MVAVWATDAGVGIAPKISTQKWETKFTENSNTSLESTYISDADMCAAMGSWKVKEYWW